MSIAIKIVDGVLQRFDEGDSFQVDSLERLSSSGDITIGSGLGGGEKISLASATSAGIEVLSDIISAGGIRLAEVLKPTAATDTGWLYTKSISSNSELFYEDEIGAEAQITDAGAVNASSIFGVGYDSALDATASTESETWETVLSETTAALASGTYLFTWNGMAETSAGASSDGTGYIRLYNSTNSTVIGDSWTVNTWDSMNLVSRGPQYVGGSGTVTFSGVAKTIIIQFAILNDGAAESPPGGDEMTVSGTRLQYWRVS